MNNELIEAAKAVIARWDSTDWESAPTIHAMNRLRAALSAKAEPECAGVYDCQNKAQREWWDMREGKLTMTHCQHMEEIEAVKGFLPIKPFGSNPDYCKPEPVGPAPCAKCGYNGPGYYQPGTHPCVSEPAKPAERLAALIAERDALLAQDETAERVEDMPAPCCGEYATCLRACAPRGEWMTVPAKLPEMKEQTPTDRDIAKLTAAHDAKLANLHAQIGDLLAISAAHAAELAEKDAEIESWKSKAEHQHSLIFQQEKTK